MNLGAIVLAAGSSSRMGQQKQLLKVDGESLLKKTVQSIVAIDFKTVVVVLGANAEAHRLAVQGLPVDIVENARWSDGMGSSLKAGMEYLLTKGSFDAVLVSVCDQPLLSPEIVERIISEYHKSNKGIVASSYSDTAGVPALFDKSYFPELINLPDDQGAKKIIGRHRDAVALIPFPGGEVDLDTMEDYNAFMLRQAKH